MSTSLAFLKEKKFGLPVWAWAIVVSLVLFLLYKHFKGSSSSSTGTTSSTPTTDTSSQYVPPDSGAAGSIGFPDSGQPNTTPYVTWGGSNYGSGNSTGGNIPDMGSTSPELIAPAPQEIVTPDVSQPSQNNSATTAPTGKTPQNSTAAAIAQIAALENPPGPKAPAAQQQAAQKAGQDYLKSLNVSLGVKQPVTKKAMPAPVKVTASSSSSGAAQAKKTGTNTQAKARAY